MTTLILQTEIGDCMRSRGWVIAGFAVYALAVVAVLVLPVSYSGIVNAIGEWLAGSLGLTGFGTGWIEFIANILMFAPLGFLLTLLFGRPWVGALLALALSVLAELGQFVIPSREPSLRDIFANALGAAIGAALAALVVRRRSPHPLDEALPEPHGVIDPRPAVEDPQH
ncbi:hypothetical protein GCM10007198_03780 [Microbacterium aerolatum]|uniref:VanZ-like domain-containing protein n=2 Tax=Microbacterium aerolatum TaxID=153731 RepID=A0A511ADK5_9MICO|nr:hypothetical protein MAE01_14240 [Microbacterium aerolatum]GGB16435.1 hypothetical protein GCM10007198_03780 [Microbacterium aerolatum]